MSEFLSPQLKALVAAAGIATAFVGTSAWRSTEAPVPTRGATRKMGESAPATLPSHLTGSLAPRRDGDAEA